MTQLDLFLSVDDAPPAVSRYRRRLARVAAQAHELGLRRAAAKRPIFRAPRSLSAAVVPVAFTSPLSRTDRGEIAVLARRLERLAPSRRDPEAYFVEKNSIVHALLRLSK